MIPTNFKIGLKFKPSFSSEIDHFEVRGYDEQKDMVLTTVFPKSGNSFDDSIEARYFNGAFETGEYVVCEKDENTAIAMPDVPLFMYRDPFEDNKQEVFDGPCCGRCQHRFGTTSNKKFCVSHCNDERCYRFKLEK